MDCTSSIPYHICFHVPTLLERDSQNDLWMIQMGTWETNTVRNQFQVFQQSYSLWVHDPYSINVRAIQQSATSPKCCAGTNVLITCNKYKRWHTDNDYVNLIYTWQMTIYIIARYVIHDSSLNHQVWLQNKFVILTLTNIYKRIYCKIKI